MEAGECDLEITQPFLLFLHHPNQRIPQPAYSWRSVEGFRLRCGVLVGRRRCRWMVRDCVVLCCCAKYGWPLEWCFLCVQNAKRMRFMEFVSYEWGGWRFEMSRYSCSLGCATHNCAQPVGSWRSLPGSALTVRFTAARSDTETNGHPKYGKIICVYDTLIL